MCSNELGVGQLAPRHGVGARSLPCAAAEQVQLAVLSRNRCTAALLKRNLLKRKAKSRGRSTQDSARATPTRAAGDTLFVCKRACLCSGARACLFVRVSVCVCVCARLRKQTQSESRAAEQQQKKQKPAVGYHCCRHRHRPP